MKLPRLLFILGLPLMVAGCALWKPTAPSRTSNAPGPERPPPRAAGPSAPGAAPAAGRPEAPEPAIVPEIEYTGAYDSVRRHGRLHALGNRIVGENGMPVSLAGNSFFWSQWQGRFYNAEVVRWLKQDWKATVIRIPMGVEDNGYLSHPEEEQARVCTLVQAAIAADMYVIIDWHDHETQRHTAQAVEFFQEMARRYGRYPNVLYEIFNEPTGDASWARDVKPCAEQIVAAIRALDPENMIIVGSPHWAQDVDVAADDPIRAKNIAYSLHFYAGTHKQWLRDKALKALQKGLPLFVTEWGTCDADGNGNIDEASTREWMDFMQQWGLSHCNWAVSDKEETASILKPGASPRGGWTADDLTPSGRLVREWMRSWAAASAAP